MIARLLAGRLPFFYGWVVIAVAFVTMGIGVNTRTAFSLLFPAILDEFGWERAVTAGAFSFGFVTSVIYAPLAGYLMDRLGPALVIPAGVLLVSGGLVLTSFASTPWELYLSMGGLVVGASVFISYIGHSSFLPRWFVRRRGLALGIAYSGVGIGSIVLFPWLQLYIGSVGWREACWALAILLAATVLPLNLLLQRRGPADLGLHPDGDAGPEPAEPEETGESATRAWARTEWTVGRALATARFWWVVLAYLFGLYGWYAVQVHQTRYLVEIGFGPDLAALALGLVGLTGIAGQIAIGTFSDRFGREWAWTLGGAGFAACYVLLIVLAQYPSPWLLYLMVAAQGLLGYGLAPLYSAVAADLFPGPRFGAILGVLSIGSTLGAAGGPWLTGLLYDRLGGYDVAFAVGFALSLLSVVAVWLAAPRKVRGLRGVRLEVDGFKGSDPLKADPLKMDSEALHAVAVGPTPIRLAPGERRELRARALGRGGPLSDGGAGVAYGWVLEPGLGRLSVLDNAGARVRLEAAAVPAAGFLVVIARRGDRAVRTERRVEIR